MNKFPIALFVTTLALCYTHPILAQTRFGLKAGYTHATMAFSDDYIDLLEFIGGEDVSVKSLPAYHVGAVVEFGFGGNFGLGTGIQWSAKGTEQVFSGVILNVPYTRTRKLMPMYLQVPLALTFRSHRFYAGAGPYFGFAIAGKDKTKTESGGSSNESSESLDFGDNQGDDFTTTDFGASFELGYAFFGNLRLSASYNLGLANIIPA
ncbi:MAG TPA: outer membrane beta-barrel protein, partial [Saprospiraceae bacterium]|nr:outer membrane beta-barrel protein [Saprospiraceae bacterium]